MSSATGILVRPAFIVSKKMFDSPTYKRTTKPIDPGTRELDHLGPRQGAMPISEIRPVSRLRRLAKNDLTKPLKIRGDRPFYKALFFIFCQLISI
jgi:hypothetical protein